MIVLGLFDCPVERFPMVLFPGPDSDLFLVRFLLAYCAERHASPDSEPAAGEEYGGGAS